MIRLLIIADDLTGALDTGVQFSKQGIKSRTICNYTDLELLKKEEDYPITVINSESRHCDKDEAYQRVYTICKSAIETGFRYFYKKTDSGLRGNMGSELAALMDATKEKELYFAPAYPEMGRITVGGIHYWNGQPIHQTAFGMDSLNPVITSDIQELLHLQTDIMTQIHPSEDEIKEVKDRCIHIFDTESKMDFYNIAQNLKERDPHILAGCAGFASVLSEMIPLVKGKCEANTQIDHLLILSGSIHQVTKDQIDYAKDHGIPSLHLSPEMKLMNRLPEEVEGKSLDGWMRDLIDSPKTLLIDTLDQVNNETLDFAKTQNIDSEKIPQIIAQHLACIAEYFQKNCSTLTLFVVGGDTLAAVMRRFHCKEIIPQDEIAEGTVLSNLVMGDGTVLPLISKSGGFGDENLFIKISQQYVTS